MYPNPLSDLPKTNGDTVHVPNQDADVELTLLYSLPAKGTGRKVKRLRLILRAINFVALILVAAVTAKMVQQVRAAINESRKVKQINEETLEQVHERHKQSR